MSPRAAAALRAAIAVALGAAVAFAISPGLPAAVIGGGAGGACAVWLPRRRQARLQIERRHRLMASLPDAIDLLASAVDGGAATALALVRVADFADEPMRSALRDAVEHAGEAGVGARLCELDTALRPLGSLLRQSEELGVPVAASLRLLAADARARARAAARERAAAAAPKMLLVVGALLAPASLLIVIGGQILVLRDVAGSVIG